MIGRDLPCSGAIGLDVARVKAELTPKCVNVFLLVIHAGKLHHMIANGRMGAVGPKHNVKVDFHLTGTTARREPISVFNPSLARAKVGTRELVVEEEFDIWEILKSIQ